MGNSHWKCSVLPVCPISLFGSLFPVGRHRVSLGEVTCTQMKHENTDKSTQPCPVKHILIGKCWDVHSTTAERERGADKPNGGQLNKWMSRGGRCAKTSLSSQQESEIDISCLCKAWISTVFWAWKVCLPVIFQFLVSYGNWDFLFLYLLQHFLPRQFLNVRSVHVLCEGNVSEWWERIIAIYSLENTTASLLSLPVLSQDVECVTEWMCQEKGEGVVKFFASLGG